MSTASAHSQHHNSIRLMVIDDSAIARGSIRRWLNDEPDIEQIGASADGMQALRTARKLQPDIILLDIEMPVMNGLDVLPKLLDVSPDSKILITSVHTTDERADMTLKCLDRGAADFISKPSAKERNGLERYKTDLLEKIRNLSTIKMHPTPNIERVPLICRKPDPSPHIPKILCMGCSTGGPEALQFLLPIITEKINIPILIVQHMPPRFTKFLAKRLSEKVSVPCREAKDGETLSKKCIYIAPGGYHMRLVKNGKSVCVALDDSPPINFCRPAVDPLFISAAKAYGNKTLAVILTGMGSDGKEGAKHIVNAGGSVLVQDKKTSVVWGMPGAVATAGLATKILPLPKIGVTITNIFEGR